MIDTKKMRISKEFLPKLIITTSPVGVLQGSKRVAEIGNPFMEAEDVSQIANLFLASPDLLVACKSIIKDTEGVCPSCIAGDNYELLEQAIAKAEKK